MSTAQTGKLDASTEEGQHKLKEMAHKLATGSSETLPEQGDHRSVAHRLSCSASAASGADEKALQAIGSITNLQEHVSACVAPAAADSDDDERRRRTHPATCSLPAPACMATAMYGGSSSWMDAWQPCMDH